MKYDHIHFKPLNEQDFELIHQWFQIPHVKKWYCRDQPYSLTEIYNLYLTRINHPKIQGYLILDNEHPVGYVQCYEVTDFLPDSVTDDQHPLFQIYTARELVGLDFYIANTAYLSSGFASQSLQQFINQTLSRRFKAIVVDPATNNHQAIKFFKKNGFIPLENCNNQIHTIMIHRLPF